MKRGASPALTLRLGPKSVSFKVRLPGIVSINFLTVPPHTDWRLARHGGQNSKVPEGAASRTLPTVRELSVGCWE